MTPATVAVHTIGQSPRPDLTDALTRRFPAVQFITLGALDDVDPREIPSCAAHAYPLETRLRDGTRIVVDAHFVEPRLQAAIDSIDQRAAIHLLLCAGSFPGLASNHPLIAPFEHAVRHLKEKSTETLEVVVPFIQQAAPARTKWEERGFTVRMHAVDEEPRGERPSGEPMVAWLGDRWRDTRAEAVVLDYVGFPTATLDALRAVVGIPVFDLGQMALDELERRLNAR